MNDLQEFAHALKYIQSVYKWKFTLNADTMQHRVCTKYANVSQRIVQCVPIVYLMASFLFVGTNIFSSWMTGHPRPPADLYLPNTLANDVLELDVPTVVVNFMLHFYSVVILGIYDATIILAFWNALMFATITCNDIETFQQCLNQKQCDAHEVKCQLLNMIQSNEKYKE